jgi:hypothetical protein
MKGLIRNAILVIACCLLLSASAKAGEFTIMPGHSLGNVWLNAPHSTVRKLWGRPYLIQRDGSYTIESWRVNKKDNNYYKSAIFRKNRVIQLETNSPRFVTPHGLSVRSNLGYIRRVLGKMRVISFGLNDPDPDAADHAAHYHAAHYYDSVARGLAFELDLGFRPDTSFDEVPHALYVHRRGHRLIAVDGEEVWAED